MNNDLISRSELLKRIDEEREFLKSRGQFGAEHILVHNFRDLIENAPTVEPEPVSERQKRALAIVDALTEKHLINVMERGCLRRSILLEPERPQSDCQNCDFRKFSERFVDSVVELMNENDITSLEQLSEMLGRGKAYD